MSKTKTPKLTTGMRIRAARDAHGLTQADLAARAGSRQEHISRIERDEHEPSLELLTRLAAALGVERRGLVGD